MELSVLLQAPNGAAGSGLGSIIMIVLIFVIFYFFMIRPQNKKQKEITKFRASLEIGKEVLTQGGLFGTIKEMTDDCVMVEIASNVKVKVDRNSIFPTVNTAELPEKK